MAVWNPENTTDISESLGLPPLSDSARDAITRDAEFRLSAIIIEARRSMRHAKSKTLTTHDISNALRNQDVEPLYGYETQRRIRFGEATIGPNQPLFYLEDEEVDFEKLINAPLPRVPREVALSNHWSAVEGVQPAIPENPVADPRSLDIGGPSKSSLMGGAAVAEAGATKPLVQHVLSLELQTYFNKATKALLNAGDVHEQAAALSSLRSDAGLHNLVPYFVQFVAEKVTHRLGELFVATQMMHLVHALMENPNLNLDPYAVALVPPVLTCLIGRRLGDPSKDQLTHFAVRDLAADVGGRIARRFAKVSETIQGRMIRGCLKCFLDPDKSPGAHYGAVLGILRIGGSEAVRLLILPALKEYESVVTSEGRTSGQNARQNERLVEVVVLSLEALVKGAIGGGDEAMDLEGDLAAKIGPYFAGKVMEGRQGREVARAILGGS